jgi:uncharacterized membrane protein YdjX (TVP38/TMEM64 family)
VANSDAVDRYNEMLNSEAKTDGIQMNSRGKPKTDGIQMNSSGKPKTIKRLLFFLLVAALFAIAYVTLGEHLSLQNLASQEAKLLHFRDDHLVLVYLLVFLLYATVTGLSLPGATGMTLVTASYLGFLPAVVTISLASTTGATIAFLFSRYLFRDSIQRRFGDRLIAFNEALEREGILYLFTLRLIPAVPFFVINLVMGLTRMRVRTYWWVSQLGMLPGTCVYVFIGSRLSMKIIADKGAAGFFRWDVFLALALLGLFPLVVKRLVGFRQAAEPGETDAPSDRS